MAREVSGKKQDLEQEVSETQAAQVQLDKAAEDFRCVRRVQRCAGTPACAACNSAPAHSEQIATAVQQCPLMSHASP
jgi:hypothetical protein